jgi:hypothetical protein
MVHRNGLSLTHVEIVMKGLFVLYPTVADAGPMLVLMPLTMLVLLVLGRNHGHAQNPWHRQLHQQQHHHHWDQQRCSFQINGSSGGGGR